MGNVSTSSTLQDMVATGSYILREPAPNFRTVLMDSIDGSVKADLAGYCMIEDLLDARFIALSDEPKPSVGAEIYRVTEGGERGSVLNGRTELRFAPI